MGKYPIGTRVMIAHTFYTGKDAGRFGVVIPIKDRLDTLSTGVQFDTGECSEWGMNDSVIAVIPWTDVYNEIHYEEGEF